MEKKGFQRYVFIFVNFGCNVKKRDKQCITRSAGLPGRCGPPGRSGLTSCPGLCGPHEFGRPGVSDVLGWQSFPGL